MTDIIPTYIFFQIKRDIASESAKEKAMDDMERKRRKIEEKRRAQDLSEFLTRQHRLKLLTKAEQVQKDLEEDIRLLDEVNAFSAVRNEIEMGKCKRKIVVQTKKTREKNLTEIFRK